MIDFIISEHPWAVTEISKEELLNKFRGKIDLDLINFMVDKQEYLEVTYSKNKNIYRFDNVSVEKLVCKFKKEEIFDFKKHSKDELRVNIDVDLQNNKIAFLNMIGGLKLILDSDIPEYLKLEEIKKFKEMQNKINKLGFKLEQIDESPRFALVCYNPLVVNIDNLSRALNILEEYTSYDNDILLDYT